jgi:hypothetical protein
METVGTPKKAKRRSKSRPGRPRSEFASYVLEIKEWDWSFSFGVNAMRNRDGPYSDYRHLLLRGNLVRPTRIKAEKVDLTFLPDHDLNEDKRERHEPKAVGSLELHSGRLIGLLSIPSDVLPPILQMMIADRFRFAVLHGERLRYGRALIRSYRLKMAIEEEDMPLDE